MPYNSTIVPADAVPVGAPAMTTRMIDSHQHLWMLSEREYAWIPPELSVLYADFGPDDVAAESIAAGITGTILVQAADTYEDTFYMLSVAEIDPRVVGVVGWVPLDRPAEASAALRLYRANPIIRGVRALTHTYDDPGWLLRDDVAQSLEALAANRFSLDIVTSTPDGLVLVAELARRHPGLTIVLDHFGKPDIAAGLWEPWAGLIAACAEEPNVYVKLSGLNTASGPRWTTTLWQPYVDHVLACFTSARVMLGSDWPVLQLAGDFGGVWAAQREVIAHLTEDQQADILFRAAERAYSLGSPPNHETRTS